MKLDKATNKKTLFCRDFMYGAGVAFAALTIVPSHVLRRSGHVPPSETIQVGGVGIGGIGSGQIRSVSQQANTKIVALCDGDDVYTKKTYNNFPKARRYRDFRKMLEAEDDKIDAVYCGTPDHTHAVISNASLKKGKHLCCVKPLTRTIFESRILSEATQQAKVATQVIASSNTKDSACRLCEMIWDGENMKFTNDSDANRYVKEPYRSGWSL